MGDVKCDEKCSCFKRGYCTKICACNKIICKLYWIGCKCKGNCNNILCNCFALGRLCDDDCKKNESCKNTYQFTEKRCAIAKSQINGYGLFSLENIIIGDYIIEYVGEIIDDDLARIRYPDYYDVSYKFELTDKIILDSQYMGNKARFINCENETYTENVEVRNRYYKGCNRLFFFAKKNINIGDELLFNYNIKINDQIVRNYQFKK